MPKETTKSGATIFALVLAALFAPPASHAQSTAQRLEIDVGVLDRFRDCSLDLRYRVPTESLYSASRQTPSQKRTAKITDGYASIPLDSSLYGLPVGELTIPIDKDHVHIQYRLRIDATSDSVVRTLETAWGVRFEEVGPDGMDDAVRKNFRMRGAMARVTISSMAEARVPTILECSPPPTSRRQQPSMQ